jgi:hypothetical protein
MTDNGYPDKKSYLHNKKPVETFYSDNTAKRLKDMYKNPYHLIKSIIRMFKFMSKPIAVLIKEHQSEHLSKYKNLTLDVSISDALKQNYESIESAEYFQSLLKKKIDMVPAIFDFCYIYYIHYFDDTAPFHKLPVTISKLRMIFNSLHIYKSKYTDINSIFEQCLENTHVLEMRQEPPCYLTTYLSNDELLEKFNNIIIPILKDLITELLKLDTKHISKK